MRQLCIHKTVFQDARFARLMDGTGWSRAESAGVLVLLWAATRNREQQRQLTREAVCAQLPFARQRAEQAFDALVDAGYVIARDALYVVADNEPYFVASDKMSVAGKRGGFPAHKDKTPRRPRAPARKKPVSEASEVWQRYREHYLTRYDAEPVRNARINRQLADLVRRIGKTDALALCGFFVAHPNAWYVRNQHAVGDMLKNCEQLVVQMRRGQAHTEHQQRSESEAGRLRAQLERLAGGA